ncbi:hypothetical protein [Paenibacillus qinlingensis]|uniref:hypothetical protein n=1 Tax=Paenibacillus qinlingensis TaxID=1837343 RepID=UPI00156692A5|nr:hypothetical protein [Paenibacillus qinlingensis]NQX57954.1 hypothetical protein [Paenibacillus qinlingensis]
MKKKTREINVGEKEYVYVINEKYHQGVSEISLSISLKGLKNIICSFRFCTWEDHMGSPLCVGVPLKKIASGKFEIFNLHNPRTVKQFVMYGLENGWNGANRIEFNNGLEILSNLGYDVSPLKP